MMEQRRDQDLRAADRAQLDRRRQEDLARLEYSGNVPTRQKGPSEGIVASFENHPMSIPIRSYRQ